MGVGVCGNGEEWLKWKGICGPEKSKEMGCGMIPWICGSDQRWQKLTLFHKSEPDFHRRKIKKRKVRSGSLLESGLPQGQVCPISRAQGSSTRRSPLLLTGVHLSQSNKVWSSWLLNQTLPGITPQRGPGSSFPSLCHFFLPPMLLTESLQPHLPLPLLKALRGPGSHSSLAFPRFPLPDSPLITLCSWQRVSCTAGWGQVPQFTCLTSLWRDLS